MNDEELMSDVEKHEFWKNKMATSQPFSLKIQIWLNNIKQHKKLNNFDSASDYAIYNS